MPRREPPEPQRDETQVADMMALNGPPSPITCPPCGGPLWETEDDGVVRYACHVGHQYAPDSLLAEHGEAVEQALWSAVRVLEQHADLRLRMSKRAEAAGIRMVAEGFAEDSHNYHLQAQHIRRPALRPARSCRALSGAVPQEGPGAIDWRAVAPPAMAKKKTKPAPTPRKGKGKARPPRPARSTRARRPAAPIPVVAPARMSGALTVVGVGASAGGLEAFSQMLRAPARRAAPGHRLRPAPVAAARERAGAVADRPDVAAGRPGQERHASRGRARLRHSAERADGHRDGELHLIAAAEAIDPQHHADRLLPALARRRRAQERAVGVILSGTRRDGAIGLREIKARRRHHHRASAGIGEVRRHAARRDRHRHGRSGAAAGRRSAPSWPSIARHALRRAPPTRRPTMARRGDRRSCGEIFDVLRPASGVDFSHYKPPTIKRRLLRRDGAAPADRRSRSTSRYCASNPDEVRSALPGSADPRHPVLPRSGSFEALAAARLPGDRRAALGRRADPHLGAGLRDRRGGLLASRSR